MAGSQRRGRCVGRAGGHRSPRRPASRSRTGRAGPGPRHRHGQRVVARRGGATWPDEASVSRAPPATHRATGDGCARSTTRASSRSSPAPCARSRPPSSADRSSRRRGPSSRSSRCWSARSAPGSRPTRRPPSASAASSSSGSTASPRSSPRPPPSTPRCCSCSPRTPRSPTPPASSSARCSPRAGEEVPEEEEAPEPVAPDPSLERRVVPQSVISRQLANPFLAPDFSGAAPRPSGPRRLATWELLGPLFRSFEYGGASSCMDLPEPTTLKAAHGLELMRHQAQLVAAAQDGHRTFLLADEPGPRQDRPGAARRRGRRTPTRCSSSSPTSSRPTGPARPSCGRRATPPP